MRHRQRRFFPGDRRAAAAASLLAAATLAGCGGGYRVEVHNDSGRPILARVVLDRAFDAEQVLEQLVIADGEVGELGPVDGPPLEPVSLVVSMPSAVGDMPSEHRLRRGYNAYVVEPGSQEDWAGIVVRRMRD